MVLIRQTVAAVVSIFKSFESPECPGFIVIDNTKILSSHFDKSAAFSKGYENVEQIWNILTKVY